MWFILIHFKTSKKRSDVYVTRIKTLKIITNIGSIVRAKTQYQNQQANRWGGIRTNNLCTAIANVLITRPPELAHWPEEVQILCFRSSTPTMFIFTSEIKNVIVFTHTHIKAQSVLSRDLWKKKSTGKLLCLIHASVRVKNKLKHYRQKHLKMFGTNKNHKLSL